MDTNATTFTLENVGGWDNAPIVRTINVTGWPSENLYVFYNADSFQPALYLVGGVSWDDAYDWFLDDETIASHLAVDMDDLDATDRAILEAGEDLEGTGWNESGRLLWTEGVQGFQVTVAAATVRRCAPTV